MANASVVFGSSSVAVTKELATANVGSGVLDGSLSMAESVCVSGSAASFMYSTNEWGLTLLA